MHGLIYQYMKEYNQSSIVIIVFSTMEYYKYINIHNDFIFRYFRSLSPQIWTYSRLENSKTLQIWDIVLIKLFSFMGAIVKQYILYKNRNINIYLIILVLSRKWVDFKLLFRYEKSNTKTITLHIEKNTKTWICL